MATKGRKVVSACELDELFGKIRPMFGLGLEFRLVHHKDTNGELNGRVSILKVTETGIETVWEDMAGNSFVDAIRAMVKFLPHVDQLPGGRVVS